eukprot:CAMPEP_0180782940 /NCGR_PEP_ID=MMETSP1038_2-20121128/48670_1 /TAXON_ID=632150 /ORGANISM="Azadinium spinosum, Strain 3D9" /LENGTH=130 /DNA_ID=CAMNT_0022819299 /DNA_START=74 /DNA_END=463 /DNA_ORIENTATION=-
MRIAEGFRPRTAPSAMTSCRRAGGRERKALPAATSRSFAFTKSVTSSGGSVAPPACPTPRTATMPTAAPKPAAPNPRPDGGEWLPPRAARRSRAAPLPREEPVEEELLFRLARTGAEAEEELDLAFRLEP